jgi:phage-related holin
MAIAAMMAIMATTIINSISVKPSFVFIVRDLPTLMLSLLCCQLAILFNMRAKRVFSAKVYPWQEFTASVQLMKGRARNQIGGNYPT